jgi:hypothetical protein
MSVRGVLARPLNHQSAAQVVIEAVDARQVWEFLRDPASSRVLLPRVVEAGVVSGGGVGERQRHVVREDGRDFVFLSEVTALVPGRLLELSLLNQSYSASRRIEVEPVDGGTLLAVRSRARGGWGTAGLGRLLQQDDDEYVLRAAQVLPVLLRPRERRSNADVDADAGART